jgi:hypothetical protein
MLGAKCFLFSISIFAFSAVEQVFPSEEQLKSKLRPGLTMDEVVPLFGEPNNGRVVPCVECTFTYLPPLRSGRRGFLPAARCAWQKPS